MHTLQIKLETRIAHISQSILEGQKDIEGMHSITGRTIRRWTSMVTKNFDNQQALLHQINANEQQIHLRKKIFVKMLDFPFFGRVDFVFEGDEEPEIFLYWNRKFRRRGRAYAADL